MVGHPTLAALAAPGVMVEFSNTVAHQGQGAIGEANWIYWLINPQNGQPVTDANGYGGALVDINLLRPRNQEVLMAALVHEGYHAYLFQQYAKDDIAAARDRNNHTLAHGGPTDLTQYERENLAYHAEATVWIELGNAGPGPWQPVRGTPSWMQPTRTGTGP